MEKDCWEPETQRFREQRRNWREDYQNLRESGLSRLLAIQENHQGADGRIQRRTGKWSNAP